MQRNYLLTQLLKRINSIKLLNRADVESVDDDPTIMILLFARVNATLIRRQSLNNSPVYYKLDYIKLPI